MTTNGMTIIERDTMYSIQNINDKLGELVSNDLTKREKIALEFLKMIPYSDFRESPKSYMNIAFGFAKDFIEVGKECSKGE